MVVRQDESPKKIALEYALIVAGLALIISIAAPDSIKEKLSQSSSQNTANAIGVFAAIAPNETNTIAQALDNKDKALTAREQDLQVREQKIGEEYKNAIAQNNRTTLFVVGGVTVFLLMLILLNFYLDVLRRKNESSGGKMHSGELQTRL